MYIKDSICISPQQTYMEKGLPNEVRSFDGNRYDAQEPDYMNLIPLGQLRRMGKAVRMGIGAGAQLVKDNQLNGIVVGTGYGGQEDCVKFLNQIIQYDEGALTPTQFVQSTPNAVAGTLGLMSQNRGYNATHVNNGHSFENAILDVLLLLKENPGNSYLLGGLDELTDYNYNIDGMAGLFKEVPVASKDLFESGTAGTVGGEGSTMFVVDDSAEGATSRIIDVLTMNFPDGEDLSKYLDRFLADNGHSASHIDGVICGMSGDVRSDNFYTNLIDAKFADANCYTFKNLVGEYATATSFAVWFANSILSGGTIPAEAIKHNSGRENKKILIHNHYKQIQHSFILIEGC